MIPTATAAPKWSSACDWKDDRDELYPLAHESSHRSRGGSVRGGGSVRQVAWPLPCATVTGGPLRSVDGLSSESLGAEVPDVRGRVAGAVADHNRVILTFVVIPDPTQR